MNVICKLMKRELLTDLFFGGMAILIFIVVVDNKVNFGEEE
jgi:hypothetical protein